MPWKTLYNRRDCAIAFSTSEVCGVVADVRLLCDTRVGGSQLQPWGLRMLTAYRITYLNRYAEVISGAT